MSNNTQLNAQEQAKYEELKKSAEDLGIKDIKKMSLPELEKAVSKAESEAKEKADKEKALADEKSKAESEKNKATTLAAPAKGTLKTNTIWEGKEYKKGDKAPQGLVEWITKSNHKLNDFVN